MRSHPTLLGTPYTYRSLRGPLNFPRTNAPQCEVNEAPGGAVLEPATQETTLASFPTGAPDATRGPQLWAGPLGRSGEEASSSPPPSRVPQPPAATCNPAPLCGPPGASAARAALPARPPRPASRPNFSRPGPEGAAGSAEPSRPPARSPRGAPASRSRAPRPRPEPRGPRSPRAHLPPPRTAGYVAWAAARPPRLCSRLAGGSGARERGARRPLPPGSRIRLPNPNAAPGHAAPCTLHPTAAPQAWIPGPPDAGMHASLARPGGGS